MTTNVNDLVKALGDLTPEQLNALGLSLKDKGVKITARKEPKSSVVYVARRLNLKDSNPNAKKVRFAGTIEYMTAKNVANVLATWVKRVKDETEDAYKLRLDTIVNSIVDNDNGVWSNNAFRIESIKDTDDLTNMPMRFELPTE